MTLELKSIFFLDQFGLLALGGVRGTVPLGSGPGEDPGHCEETMCLGCPGNTSRPSLVELEEVWRRRKSWHPY